MTEGRNENTPAFCCGKDRGTGFNLNHFTIECEFYSFHCFDFCLFWKQVNKVPKMLRVFKVN
jgi:hypothetical protein